MQIRRTSPRSPGKTRLAADTRSAVRILIGSLLASVSVWSTCVAQTTTIGNQFIQCILFTSPPENRFTINAGPAQNNVKFLYGATSNTATSNIVFRIESGGSVYYYTNCNGVFGYYPKDLASGARVPFKRYDSMYVSADTVAIGYKNMSGWNVTQRWIVEKPRTPYDDGTDMLLEFTATVNPFTPPGSIGVFLMLDLFNGEAGDPNPSDFTSVITDRGYYPRGMNGKRFDPAFDTIPNFYTTGNVTMQPAAAGAGVPYNIRMPIHRLTGISQGGKPLTPPDMFAIGDWRTRMREYSWDVPSSDVGTTPLNDAATCMRWGNITDGKTVRTAFGMNNRLGNNIFTCRDTGFFVMMRTERIVEQRAKNGSYSPTSFDLEVWVVNLDNSLQRDLTLYFQQPIQSNRGPNRLLLDPSTPAVQGMAVPANGVRKTRFRLNFNPAFSDDSADVVPELRYAVPKRPGVIRRFKHLCMPTITIKKYIEAPPPLDTIAPTIARGIPGRGATAFWPFTIYDRHRGYDWDTGLDGLVIEANVGNNFRLLQNPAPFVRCDTTVTVALTAEVIDTTRPGHIVFRASDCRGNIRRDSAVYNPRPDLFPPSVVRVDSAGSYGPGCNTRVYQVFVLDSLVQQPDAGDNGLGTIGVIGVPANFFPLEINVDNGGVPIADFDRRASFRTTVIDTMSDAHMDVRIADYAGNADTVALDYCTLPDIQKPHSTVIPTATGGPWTWMVGTSDSLPWDRGLQDVVVLSNPGSNMSCTLPPIVRGARTASWDVSLVDDRSNASIVFEVRDVWYATTPVGHADTIAITYEATPDTLAPNIVYTPIPGSGGSRADVSINDIHFFGADRYKYDVGLAAINAIAMTPNMELASSIAFAAGDTATSFGIRVRDTLALSAIDSICIEAVDLAGNRSTLCYHYPVVPDILPPVFTGRIDRPTGRLIGTLSDDRQYDRGLGDVRIDQGTNIEVAAAARTFAGEQTAPFVVAITDTAKPVSGTIVLRDLIARSDLTGESDPVHSTRLAFELPVASIAVELPAYIEGGADLCGVLIAQSTIPGGLVNRLAFTVLASGDARFASATNALATVGAVDAGGRIDVRMDLDPGRMYFPGDTLGSLVWTTQHSPAIESFALSIDPASLVANNGSGSTIIAGPVGQDTALSRLELPAPLFRVAADSTVFVNGDCERFLTTTRGAGKPAGLAILGVRPLPVKTPGGVLQIDVRDLPPGGATVDLVDASGHRTILGTVTPDAGRVVRRSLHVPDDLGSGTYIIRLITDAGIDWARLVVTR